jgi:hypothetical protein
MGVNESHDHPPHPSISKRPHKKKRLPSLLLGKHLPTMRSFATPSKGGDNKKGADFRTSGPNRSSSGGDDDDYCGRSVSSLTTVPVSNVAVVVVTPGSDRASKKMPDSHRRGGGGHPFVPPPRNRTERLRDSVLRLGELKGQLEGQPRLRELRRQLGEAQGWVQQLLQQQLPTGNSDSPQQPGEATEGNYLRNWLQERSWLVSELELELGAVTRPLLYSVESWIRPCLEQDASYDPGTTTTTTLTQGEEEERRARRRLQEEQSALARELQARAEAIRRRLSQVDLLMQELRRGDSEERTVADEERAGQPALLLRILQALDGILATADDVDQGTDAGPIVGQVVVYAGSGSHATMSTVTGQISEASAARGGGEEEEDEEGVGEGDKEGVAGEDEKGAAPMAAGDAGSYASMSTVTLTSKGGSPDTREPGSGGL